jgi:hypothetical protein
MTTGQIKSVKIYKISVICVLKSCRRRRFTVSRYYLLRIAVLAVTYSTGVNVFNPDKLDIKNTDEWISN